MSAPQVQLLILSVSILLVLCQHHHCRRRRRRAVTFVGEPEQAALLQWFICHIHFPSVTPSQLPITAFQRFQATEKAPL